MADGKLVQMLIFTDVTRYLEFKVRSIFSCIFVTPKKLGL